MLAQEAAEALHDRQCVVQRLAFQRTQVGRTHLVARPRAFGALGWVAMVSIGAMYHLIPVLFGRKDMHSIKAINAHFWLATIGTVLYIASMWVNGIMQGLMWRAYNNDGTLTYSFAESVLASHPGYIVRLIGGAMFFLGMLIMAWNTWKTVSPGTAPVTNAQAQPA